MLPVMLFLLMVVSRELLARAIIGGYADDIRPTLLRLCPTSLTSEGLGWEDATEFVRRYGRVDTVITDKSGPSYTTGLAAMGGSGDGMEMALAKSLAENLDFGEAERAWQRVCASPPQRRFEFKRLRFADASREKRLTEAPRRVIEHKATSEFRRIQLSVKKWSA